MTMVHCSHCLAHFKADILDDFVCCSSCGKVIGQFSAGKYIDHSKPLFNTSSKFKKTKTREKIKAKTKNQYQNQGQIAMDSSDPQLTVTS